MLDSIYDLMSKNYNVNIFNSLRVSLNSFDQE